MFGLIPYQETDSVPTENLVHNTDQPFSCRGPGAKQFNGFSFFSFLFSLRVPFPSIKAHSTPWKQVFILSSMSKRHMSTEKPWVLRKLDPRGRAVCDTHKKFIFRSLVSKDASLYVYFILNISAPVTFSIPACVSWPFYLRVCLNVSLFSSPFTIALPPLDQQSSNKFMQQNITESYLCQQLC